jgi:hypothetical protein
MMLNCGVITHYISAVIPSALQLRRIDVNLNPPRTRSTARLTANNQGNGTQSRPTGPANQHKTLRK